MKTLALLFALLCSGCANHIVRVQSSWYIIETEEGKPPATYLTLLNRGNTTIHIKSIIINPIRDEIFLFKDVYHDGWERAVDKTLEPGQVLVTLASEFSRKNEQWTSCRMPVEVNVEIASRDRVLVTEHQPALPNTLPWAWESICLLKGGTP